jgi:hypothetical protein
MDFAYYYALENIRIQDLFLYHWHISQLVR